MDCKYFQKQVIIPEWDQKILDISSLVIGVGGNGTHLAMNLCRMGIKELNIVDFDIVEEHNLNRQILYNKRSIDQKKLMKR